MEDDPCDNVKDVSEWIDKKVKGDKRWGRESVKSVEERYLRRDELTLGSVKNSVEDGNRVVGRTWLARMLLKFVRKSM